MARYEYLIYLRQYHARDKHTRIAAQPVVKVEWKGGGGGPRGCATPQIVVRAGSEFNATRHVNNLC